VEFSLDLRDVDEALRDGVERRIREGAQEICRRRGVALEVEVLQRIAPAPCSELVMDAGRARVEAKAALEQAEELRRVLEELEGLLGR
jgi:allantoate deiminase